MKVNNHGRQGKRKLVTAFAVLSLITTTTFGVEIGKELIPDGNFDKKLDWVTGRGVSIAKIGDNSVLQFKGSYVFVKKIINISGAKELKLKMRMKTEGVEVGKAKWMDGRLVMRFLDKSGKMVGQWPRVFHEVGTTPWTDCERVYEVPEGAETIELKFGNFGSEGTVQFDDVSLAVVK